MAKSNNPGGRTSQQIKVSRNLANTLQKYLDPDEMGTFLHHLWAKGTDPVTGDVVPLMVRLAALQLHVTRADGAPQQHYTIENSTTHEEIKTINLDSLDRAGRNALRLTLRRTLEPPAEVSDDNGGIIGGIVDVVAKDK